MIEIRLEFKPGMLKQLAEKLLSLPLELRPSHVSLAENEKAKAIGDKKGFIDSLNEGSLGPYLTGDHCAYQISLAAPKPIICEGTLDAQPALAKLFLMEMSSISPIFGFACLQEEWFQKNRITTQQGINKIESWVGRDTEKYVPGLYWLTLISDALSDRHGVSLSAVQNEAKEHVTLEGGQHLFRFYDQPEDWRKTSSLSAFCRSTPGIFDLEAVRKKAQKTSNFLELNSLLSEWK